MTRLREADIEPISGGIDAYDARLRRITGVSLRELACKAAGVQDVVVLDTLGQVRFAAVPITSGLGVIEGFSGAVATILSHLGLEVSVTQHPDVAGIVEAVEGGADVLMLADDDRFVAIAPGQRQVVDNATATAQGFVAGLELMKGELSGESVLVLGCGPVGLAATRVLRERGASVSLCDINQERAMAALRDLGRGGSERLRMEETPRAALKHHDLIFDATNAGGFIEKDHLTLGSFVAAPGMPCALTAEAMAENRDRLLHDALEIGTATMAVQAAATLAGRRGPGRIDEP